MNSNLKKRLIISFCALVVLLPALYAGWHRTRARVIVEFDDLGLSRIEYHGTNLLKSGAPPISSRQDPERVWDYRRGRYAI